MDHEKPLDGQTGDSELTATVGTDFDFNLKNYSNLGSVVVKVNQLLQQIPHGASTLVYRRLTGNVFAPACTLPDDTCTTAFQNQPMDNFACGLYGKIPGAMPWKENAFYDRSLVGRWMIVIPDDVYAKLGTVSAVEISFVVASLTL